MILRDYQLLACDGIEAAWLTNQSTLCVMATGLGKTILAAEIIRRRQPGRALVVANRGELIYQAQDKIETTTGLHCEIEMADQAASTNLWHQQPVVIATIQTLISGNGKLRMERFNPDDFSTIIVDEAHRCVSPSFRKVIDYFLQNKEAKLLGLTATPDRFDEEALGQVCQSVAFDYGILDGIENGWLVPIEQAMVEIKGLDFSAVHTLAGDLNNGELASIMESEKNLHGLCSATLDMIGNRQAIVFTTSVKHAEMCCDIFNRHKSRIASWVCGKTEKYSRRETLKGVYSGETQIIVNVGVLCEGFDAPSVEVIVMGRPTKSRSLYSQQVGRGTRPLPGIVDGLATAGERRAAIAASVKPSMLVLDFMGNSGRHKLITSLDILGGNYSDEVKELAERKMREDGKSKRIQEALTEAEAELAEEKRKEIERRIAAEEARKAKVKPKAVYVSRSVDPFDRFTYNSDLKKHDGSGRKLTHKQRAILVKQGVDPDKIGFAESTRILNETIRRWKGDLCSIKQAALLKRFGFPEKDYTRPEATKLIDALAKNNWRKPEAKPAPPVAAPIAQPVHREELIQEMDFF